MGNDSWDGNVRMAEEWSAEERKEYSAILDADDVDWWSAHCPVHGTELVQEGCVECAGERADEQVQDK